MEKLRYDERMIIKAFVRLKDTSARHIDRNGIFYYTIPFRRSLVKGYKDIEK